MGYFFCWNVLDCLVEGVVIKEESSLGDWRWSDMYGTRVVFKGWVNGINEERAHLLLCQLIEEVFTYGYKFFYILLGQVRVEANFRGKRWRVTVVIREEDVCLDFVGRVGYEVEKRVDRGTWDMEVLDGGDLQRVWEVLGEWSESMEEGWERTYKVVCLDDEEFRRLWDRRCYEDGKALFGRYIYEATGD